MVHCKILLVALHLLIASHFSHARAFQQDRRDETVATEEREGAPIRKMPSLVRNLKDKANGKNGETSRGQNKFSLTRSMDAKDEGRVQKKANQIRRKAEVSSAPRFLAI